MRPWTAHILIAGTAASACSGKYEVGQLMALGSTSGGELNLAGTGADFSSGNASGGSASTSTPISTAGTMSAGPGLPTLGPECVVQELPAAPTAPFAAPETVWQRLSPLIWGRQVEPPFRLPTTTTPSFATTAAELGFADVVAEQASVLGAEAFVRSYLDLEPGAPLLGRYGSGLSRESPVVAVLLTSFLLDEQDRIVDQRQGVFTEPSWLSPHATISARGHHMRLALFREAMPRHGADGVDVPEVPQGLSDRQTITQQTAAASCFACHKQIDPLGFVLGHFDEAGAYRLTDEGLEIDTSGSLASSYGETLDFDSVQTLGVRLTNNCEANLGVVDAFLRFALTERGATGAELDVAFATNRDSVRKSFVDGGRTYLALLRAYAQSSAALMP